MSEDDVLFGYRLRLWQPPRAADLGQRRALSPPGHPPADHAEVGRSEK